MSGNAVRLAAHPHGRIPLVPQRYAA